MEPQVSADNSPLEMALAAFRGGDYAQAEELLSAFVRMRFDIALKKLTIRRDALSLNSVNGFIETAEGGTLFFKFHMEEDEAESGEYYRAQLLSEIGYPVEEPLFTSQDKGEQFLIYPYVESARLADLCREQDSKPADDPLSADILNAQAELDKICAAKCLETMTEGTPEILTQEPVLQLFYWRLVDQAPDGSVKPGGRFKSFYEGKDFTFPDGVTLNYDELAAMTWVVNNVRYGKTLAQCFADARKVLAPDHYAQYAAYTGHGDAHNGNVWAHKNLQAEGGYKLSWFDPAFAGTHIPVLLGEIKPTFHNIFAHADWLYNAAEADGRYNVRAEIKGQEIHVTHDWHLPELREGFLQLKKELFWIPVLKVLNANGKLPADWQDYMRLALFCCPTLVMNLRAAAGTSQNAHTPKTSLLGLSIAMMLGSAPDADGKDVVSTFFDEIEQAIVG